MVPETDATEYDSHFEAFGPKYFITAVWLTNTPMAPAMKNAGTRQRRFMLPRVPFGQLERLDQRALKTRRLDGQVVEHEKGRRAIERLDFL